MDEDHQRFIPIQDIIKSKVHETPLETFQPEISILSGSYQLQRSNNEPTQAHVEQVLSEGYLIHKT